MGMNRGLTTGPIGGLAVPHARGDGPEVTRTLLGLRWGFLPKRRPDRLVPLGLWSATHMLYSYDDGRPSLPRLVGAGGVRWFLPNSRKTLCYYRDQFLYVGGDTSSNRKELDI